MKYYLTTKKFKIILNSWAVPTLPKKKKKYQIWPVDKPHYGLNVYVPTQFHVLKSCCPVWQY